MGEGIINLSILVFLLIIVAATATAGCCFRNIPIYLPADESSGEASEDESPDVLYVRIYDSKGQIFQEYTFAKVGEGEYVQHGREAQYMWIDGQIATYAYKDWSNGEVVNEKVGQEFEGSIGYPYLIENDPKVRYNESDNSIILRLGRDELPKNLPGELRKAIFE